MTVRELIAELSKYPPDQPRVWRADRRNVVGDREIDTFAVRDPDGEWADIETATGFESGEA